MVSTSALVIHSVKISTCIFVRLVNMKHPIICIVIILAIIQEIQSIFLEIYAGMLIWDWFFSNPKTEENTINHKAEETKQQAEQQKQQQILSQQQEAQKQQILQQQEAQKKQQQISQQSQQEAERLRLQKIQIDVIRQKQSNELNRQEIVSAQVYGENHERLIKIMNYKQQQMFYQIEKQKKLNESLGIRCIARVKLPDRYEENAWREYLFDWQYDYCMIASI